MNNSNNSKCYLKIVGDVHGKSKSYKKLISKAEYSLQLGDMGFDYDFFEDVDSEHHKFFGGNHDNYDRIDFIPNNLGNFGVWDVPDFGPVFWVRGGWSIDRPQRTPGFDWFFQEELDPESIDKAYELYCEIKPKIIVTHECPFSIVEYVGDPRFTKSWGYDQNSIPTRTNMLLERMTEFHQPLLHVFGHFHCNFDKIINKTRYVCLPELGVLDLDKNFVNHLGE